ncbi:MAG: AAA family ATPase, partial [Verrucomicrobiales bacterium]
MSDPSIPAELRRKMLRAAITDSAPGMDEFLDEMIAQFSSGHAKSHYEQKSAELAATLNELEAGPLRCAAFVALEEPVTAGSVAHALVLIDDGSSAYCAVPDSNLAASLRKGDRVLVDGRGKAVLRRASAPMSIGDEAIFERVVNEGNLEVSIQDRERCVFLPTQALEDRIRSGEVAPGDTLLVNIRQRVAFDALPKRDSLNHFQYLVKDKVPNVNTARDVGYPAEIIKSVRQMVRDELTKSEIRRRFGLRRCSMNLLLGRPGTGKSLTIEAIWREIYEIMSEITGVPIDDLPDRVFRLSPAKILSQWLGQSDQNIDRFFDEVEQLAATPWTSPDGTVHELPVIVILEEIDGLAKTRGQEGIYDRILTGMLQRLDPNRSGLKDKLVVFLGTTNEAKQVDGAFLRRIGARVETFGSPGRKGFTSILTKRLGNLPVSHNGFEDPRQSLVADVTDWLFSRNGSDPGVVELTYAGATTPEIRYRRDFLTGALIDRAIESAAEKAAHEATIGQEDA